MPKYSFLTDENIHPDFVAYLRQNGFSVLDVKEEKLNGKTDQELLDLSLNKNLIVITHDSDFGRLIFAEGRPFKGIIFLRPGNIKPNFHFNTFETLLAIGPFPEKPFFITAENFGDHIRVRITQL